LTLRRRWLVTVPLVAVLASVSPIAAAADDVREQQWHLRFLNVAAAHRSSTGTGVTVAVIDSGVDGNHPDLAGNVLPGVDLVEEGGNGWTDTDGHGTSMGSLIAAHGRNGHGILGIAPSAKILPIRNGRGGTGFRMDLGIEAALARKASVISISSTRPSAGIVEENLIKRAIAENVVVVAGVGNTNVVASVGYPAAYSGVMAVAGVDRSGTHAPFSVTGHQVVLSAPAVDIVSAAPGGGTATSAGTSDATAIMAGAVALVRSKFPHLNAQQVVNRLTSTAIDKGPPGRDPIYGFGVVDLVKALTAEIPGEGPAPSPSATGSPSAAEPSGGVPGTGLLVGGLVVLVLLIGGAYLFVRRGAAGSPPGS